jgi:hypothetical protein
LAIEERISMLRRLTFLLGPTALAAVLSLPAGDSRGDDGTTTREPSPASPAETGGPWPGMLADRGWPIGVPKRPVYYDPLHPVRHPWRPNRLILSYPAWGWCAGPVEQPGRALGHLPAAPEPQAQPRASGGAAR